jgi:Cytochrome c7 and related cytochrome c
VRLLVAGLLLGVLPAFWGCREPAPVEAGEPPGGVRTPLPAAVDEVPACGPEPSSGPVSGTAAPAVQVVLGKPGEPAPVDEIPFSHKAHAGDCAIPCPACHLYAEKSPVAGLPSGKKCMGCHKFVAKEKPAVQVLAARVRAEQPLRWTRVFELPDFVYFTHRVHLNFREKIECKECHGDVATMKVVRQDEPFTMGRCLTCHEKKNVRHDCVVCHR